MSVETGTVDAEVGEREKIYVRTMRAEDLKAIVGIDGVSSGAPRPQYFELLIERSLRQAAMQVSLVAESEGRVTGFVVASVYFGEYGILEPTASIDAIGVDPATRRQRVAHALMLQLGANLRAVGVTTIRTEVDWSDIDLLGFFKSEGFAPAPRLCLERRLA